MRLNELKRRKFYVESNEQWSGLFSRTGNWYDFTFVHFEVEFSPYKGSAEVAVGLLGVNLMFTYVYDFQFTDSMMSKADEMRADLKAATGAEQIHDPFKLLDQAAGESERKAV